MNPMAEITPKNETIRTHYRLGSLEMSDDIKWWAGKDSNLRRLCRQIYSLLPLAAWVPTPLCCLRGRSVAAAQAARTCEPQSLPYAHANF